MQVKGDALLNKLILLFVFDKMECPLTENTIIDMCCSSNNWISYMDCKPIMNQLLEYGFIYSLAQNGGDTLYSITPDGRVCLADFFIQIPSSIRENISRFVKANSLKYRKKQEFISDYYMPCCSSSVCSLYFSYSFLYCSLAANNSSLPSLSIPSNEASTLFIILSS